MLNRLAVVRVAQQAGFTISEIRTLLDGFSEDTPPSERRRILAQDKLPEVEALVERALSMKDLLERGLRCECLRLEECSLVGNGAPEALTQRHSRSRAPIVPFSRVRGRCILRSSVAKVPARVRSYAIRYLPLGKHTCSRTL